MSQEFYKQVIDEHLKEVLDAYKADKITKETAVGKILKCMLYAKNKLKDEDNRTDTSDNDGASEASSIQQIV